jgi:hypothetical protein
MIGRADTFNQRQRHATVTTTTMMIARIDSSLFSSALSALSAVIRPCARQRQRARPKQRKDLPQRTQRAQRSIRRNNPFNRRQLHATVAPMIARIDSSLYISAFSALSAVIRLCARRRRR